MIGFSVLDYYTKFFHFAVICFKKNLPNDFMSYSRVSLNLRKFFFWLIFDTNFRKNRRPVPNSFDFETPLVIFTIITLNKTVITYSWKYNSIIYEYLIFIDLEKQNPKQSDISPFNFKT